MFALHQHPPKCRRSRRWVSSAVLRSGLSAWAFVAVATVSFAAQPQAFPPSPLEGEEAVETLQTIRSLVLPQQKQWARELIKQQPDTPLAKLAQQLLDEYKLYDAARDAEKRRAESRTKRVRAFWKGRYRLAPKPVGSPLRITNQTDQPVLYQVKGPSMGWTGPHRLRPGQTHKFHYPVIYRRFTKAGARSYSLSVGTQYVFQRPQKEGLAELFRGPQDR